MDSQQLGLMPGFLYSRNRDSGKGRSAIYPKTINLQVFSLPRKRNISKNLDNINPLRLR